MTYEQFRQLAFNPPYPEGKSAYRIDVYRFKSKHRVAYYPSEFEVTKSQSLLYPDFDTAQFMVRRFFSKEYMNEQLYALYVYELPYNTDISTNLYRRLWVYNRNGRIISQSLCSSLVEDLSTSCAKFRGRDDSFKPGDIVEVYDRDKSLVSTGVVVQSPRTIEQCWEVREIVEKACLKEGVGADYTDDNYWLYADEDSYAVVVGDDKIHHLVFPHATDVLPLSQPIPPSVQNQYDRNYRVFMQDHHQEINRNKITEQTVRTRITECKDLINLL